MDGREPGVLDPTIIILIKIISTWWIIQAAYGPLKAWISRKLLIRQRNRLQKAAQNARCRPVTLIIAAKDVSPSFDHFLDLILHQDYPDYRLIFVTQSAEDPARQAILDHLNLAPGIDSWHSAKKEAGRARQVNLVVAGLAQDEGQKVHNQLAAFQHLEPGDEIIAFADADIVGGPEWLMTLVTPINVGEAELTTGYRWFLPKTRRFSTLVATNINSGIGVLAGPSWHTLLWGGSMALSAEVFREIDVPGKLRGSVNDDLQISRVAREAGHRLFFVRSLMALSPVDYTWRGLFEFGRRQYFQVRIFVPRYWWVALFFTGSWMVGWGLSWWRLLVWNDLRAFIPLSIVGFMIVLKLVFRQPYLHEQFDRETIRQLRPARLLELVTTTLNMAVHLLMVLGAATIGGIRWAGIRYRVRGRQKTEVVSRG